MKKLLLFIVFVLLVQPAFSAVFYTVANGKAEHTAVWKSDDANYPFPLPTDELIIRHTIKLNAGISYTHFGNITIEKGARFTVGNQFVFAGGTFNINGSLLFGSSNYNNIFTIQTGSTVNVNVGAVVTVLNSGQPNSIENNGTLNIYNNRFSTSGSIVNNNTMLLADGSVVQIGNIGPQPSGADFIANSTSANGSLTTVNGELRISDDLIIDGTTAKICGDCNGTGCVLSGSISMGPAPSQGGEGSTIELLNGALEEQICAALREKITNAPLPVDILSIAIKNNSLVWNVFEERIMGYNVEYSEDIENWNTVTSIDSKGDGRNEYSKTINKAGYYRIKVLSLEEVKFSSILYYSGSEDLAFFPTILKSGKELTFTGAKLINSIELFNSKGNLIKVEMTESGVININQAPGVYFIRILGKNKLVKTGKLIIE